MADEESLKAPPEPALPMTEADAVSELQDWYRRCGEAGLSPATIAIRVGFKRGVGLLDGFLATVETNIGAGAGKK